MSLSNFFKTENAINHWAQSADRQTLWAEILGPIHNYHINT